MQNVTLGEFSGWITLIAGLIIGTGAIYKALKNIITKMLETEFENVNKKLDDLNERIETVDVETCKNFLVARLAELEKGLQMDEIEKARLSESLRYQIDEPEAHRRLQRSAMRHGMKMADCAALVLQSSEEPAE